MTRCALRVVPLSAEHDRSTFASGPEPLDNYFRQRVTQGIHHGFIPLPDSPMTLFLPLATVSP